MVAGVGILKEFLYEKWLERMGRDSWSFEESYLMESSGRVCFVLFCFYFVFCFVLLLVVKFSSPLQPFHLIFFFITLFKFASALLSFPSCSLGPIFPQPCASFFFALSDGVFFLFLFLFSGGWGLLSPLSLDLVRQSFCYLLMVFFFFCSFLSIDAKVIFFIVPHKKIVFHSPCSQPYPPRCLYSCYIFFYLPLYILSSTKTPPLSAFESFGLNQLKIE